MKYLSLFSGIEAASVAWKPLGWEPIGFSEIEPFPSAVLKHHFPNTPNYGDITKWKEWGLVPGTVDLVCAGSPCQAFSIAGLRKGLDDPRGNLALVTLGLVEFLQPKWFIWENVCGVLNSNGGRDFAAFLTALGNIGYGWAYRVLNAEHFGLAQRRRRVWLVACRSGDWQSAAGTLFDEESLSWDNQTRASKRKETSEDASGCPEQGDRRGCYWDGGQVTQTLDAVLAKGQTMPEKNRFPAVLVPSEVQTPTSDICGTLRANPGSGWRSDGTPVEAVVTTPMSVRRLSIRECERLQGFPDDHTLIPWKGKPKDKCPSGPRYKAIGNSWAVPCARWIGERIELVESIKNEAKK
jgi:DNA (cytosine-5)-methyltransferase 1